MTDTKKVVLITGAGSGIGQATAELFAERGWQVIAGVRDPNKYHTKFTHASIHIEAIDVTQPNSILTVIQAVVARYGRIDVLVNNAGHGLYGAFEQCTPEEIQQQYAVNVFGVMNMCRAVIPVMRQQRSGSIVNISSMGGKFAVPYYNLYTSTKFAIEGFSEGLFYELLPFGIRVKVIEPGGIKTDFYGRSQKNGCNVINVPLYDTVGQKLQHFYNASGSAGLPPAAAAQVIYCAATSHSRRLRYAVGFQARINMLMFKLFPHQIAMWLTQKTTVDR